MEIIFEERQKFTQWWFWLLLIGLGGIAVYGFVTQIILGKQFGNKPISDVGMAFFVLGIFGFIYFNWSMTLISEINDDGIKMRFIPFVKRNIPWNEIQSVKIVNYGFVGYGIRLGSKYGTVYNINGNKGLAIELKNGKKFVIGTQRENELNKALKKVPVASTLKN